MAEKIAVLMGGRSLEREVSLKSGERVVAALEAKGYRTAALDVTTDLVARLRSEKPDAVYIALHGKFGEDGGVQEVLEFLGIPYTGPGVLACAMSWDKAVAKRVFAGSGVDTPCWVTFSADAFKEMGAGTALELVPEECGGFPLVVKPAGQGSGLGLTRVEDLKQLPEALLTALGYDSKAIVEKWVEGPELAVGVLDGDSGPEVLPPVEIVIKPGMAYSEAMYTRGAVDYFVPARLDEGTDAKVRETAKRVHETLGARDVSRVDMVVGPDGTPYVLEVNSSPGLTETSLLPMAAESTGMGFEDLVERIAKRALQRG